MAWNEKREANTPDTQQIETTPWKLRWTAAIDGLLLLCFFIGASFMGAVHQVGWLAATKERVITWTHFALQPEQVAYSLMLQFNRSEPLDQDELTTAAQKAPEFYRKSGIWLPDGNSARSYLLIDKDNKVAGLIAFYDTATSLHGNQIGVYDPREQDYLKALPRDQLPEIMRRYQDELYPFY